MPFPPTLSPDLLQLASELGVLEDDITERFTRGGGPGGQKINTTSNCVELIHEPSSTRVRVQRHRERSKNRLSAYKLLLQKVEHHVKGHQSAKAQQIYKLKKQKQRRSKKAKEKMLQAKHRRSSLKENRRSLSGSQHEVD